MGRLGKSLRSILCNKQQVWPTVSSQQDVKAPVQPVAPVALSTPFNVPQNVPNSVHNVFHVSNVVKSSVQNMVPLMPVNVPQRGPPPVHNTFHISQMVKTSMQPVMRPQPVNFLNSVPAPVYHALKPSQFIPVAKAIPVHEETPMEVDDPDVVMKDLSRPKRKLPRIFLNRPSFPLFPATRVVVPMQVDLPILEGRGENDKMDVDTKPLEPRNIVNDDQEPSEELRRRRTPSGTQLVVDLADELEALSLHEYASKDMSMPAGADMDALCDKLDSISLTDEIDRLTELMAKLTISDDEEDETTLVASQTSTGSDTVAKPYDLPCSQISPWGSFNSFTILTPPTYRLILPLPVYTPSKSYLGLFARRPVIPFFLKSSIWMKWRKPTSRKSTKHRLSFAKVD
ncbi:uncharacterized protein LAESUDRAFT_760075 [Laetiporus sulphureus 93-53]|uniref:Uncharacterized protein n=1 Tax=Laetiporus sulphureus 93-53 TaxID=1314785 RepID=A0A165DS52_9APHY|nr:uncharacterized protein LAESUDRAFT_760075 [Laetiporus sulphureus 93-53]KZT05518.1 hypothetical protein LAESUDRAFT_760075 [Laetiporus sulphureus 93-53]